MRARLLAPADLLAAWAACQPQNLARPCSAGRPMPAMTHLGPGPESLEAGTRSQDETGFAKHVPHSHSQRTHEDSAVPLYPTIWAQSWRQPANRACTLNGEYTPHPARTSISGSLRAVATCSFVPGAMSHAVEERIASSSAPADGVPLPRSIRRHHSVKQRFRQRNHKPPSHRPCLQRAASLSRVPQPRTSPVPRASLTIISFAAAQRWRSKRSFSSDRRVNESMERPRL